VRSLREVAIENATEGCVRETYGAMVAQRQAASAQNPFVRAAFERIAVDEARHSALSWEVDAWAQRRLGRHDRAQLSTARREAVATLERQLQTESSAALQRDAGLPPADEAVETARRLFDALES
jgi:rubrerythrin